MKRTITAMFDRYQDAAESVRRLETAGIPHGDISIVSNDASHREHHGNSGYAYRDRNDTGDDAADGAGTGASLGTLLGGGAGLLAGLGMLAIPGLGPVVAAGWLASTLVGAGAGAAAGGLVGSLAGAGVSESDAEAYAEGVRRGGTLVTARVEEAHFERALDILDDEGTIDMDEREKTWRAEGWTGGRTIPGAVGGAVTGAAGAAASTLGIGDTTGSGRTGMGSASTSGTAVPSTGTGVTGAASRGEEVIPVVEESLAVGKREVSGGRVRVHSHVVEKPVQEQVNLREEHVSVERRPVDRAVTDRDNLFKDRTIEASEKREEAVVSKEARVTEELVVKKDVEQETRTVSDTVRQTKVEVDDDRTGRKTGTAGTTTDPLKR
ncbi:MAG: hypothetical protein AVDCRST_MAG90-659 [uncultured Microvirga sp.]|uniref:DUF2382 domain-containing protein n=1 Tax=uncultured Microvirga sp. TaxID=412392 RepID=A0A6J4KUC3_9HYPH|nr:MAG: hypothetical protein AVDCRST_MAG90-659 [uncultured Microvirga sp.]